LFLIGLRQCGEFQWPEPASEITTLRDAIGDLPPVPPAQRSDRVQYFGPRSAFQRRMRDGLAAEDSQSIYDHITRDVRPDDAEAFTLLAEGETYIDLPTHLRRYRSDIFTDKYKRLAWNEVCRSITAHIAKDGYWYIHPQQHRTLSVREAARVQTFPDWFRFAGQPSLRLKQIGNAVPPLLGEALGGQIRLALANAEQAPRDERSDFRSALIEWHMQHRRNYPWRAGGSDPWLVLAAELSLARTRADLVPTIYERLRELAPTPRVLLERHDPVSRLKELGLGARAAILTDVAAALEARFDGKVPEEELALRSLPGVGDGVAQAVRCFAFGRMAVLLDVSTARLTERYFGRSGRRRWQTRLDLYRLAGAQGPDAEFNSALLDHGALVCRADAPRCGECPLQSRCAARGGFAGSLQLTLTSNAVASVA
jgi:DNA (cytosine-5)-methyltransferase 1